MSALSIASFAPENCRFSGATATLRIWYSQDFVDSDGNLVMGGPQNFYQTIECTVVNGVLTVPSFSLVTTDDVQEGSPVVASARLYDASGAARDVVFSQFVIPNQFAPSTTIGNLRIFNRAVTLRNPPLQFLTREQVLALIRSIGNVLGPDESTDNAIAVWDGTDGGQLRDSGAFIDSGGNLEAANFTGFSEGVNTGDQDLTGLITGPGSSTDNAAVRFNGVTGQLLQDGPVLIADDGLVSGVKDPETAQDAASKNYVDTAVAAVSGNVPIFSGLSSGGIVVWEGAYLFRVSAAIYYIQGALLSSLEQTITLDAADPTLDRIDVIALDNTGTVVKITGVAAAQPSQPDIDPSTQLQLTFVFVAAASTQPSGVTNEDIYIDNAEWTATTSGSGWNPNSTNNPHSGTKDIEGTNVANNAYVQLQASAPLTLDSYGTLSMFIRSKAQWGNNRVLRVQFYSSGVAKGNAITIASGFWGFNSSTLGSYQLVAIPMAQFVIPAGTSINQLRITDSGGSIGLYIDDIVLQANGSSIGTPPTAGMTQDQGDARYAQRSNNLSDLNSASAARTNLGLGALAVLATVGTAQIDNDAVSDAKLANMPTATFKGRTTGGTGDPENLTATQATALLNNVVGDSGAGGAKGLVPAPGAGDAAAGKVLGADGTWVTGGGGGSVLESQVFS